MLVLALLGLAAPASALATADPVFDNSVTDPVNLSGATAVAVSGKYAYTTAYGMGQLTAVDVSNPAHPLVAGESAQSNNLLNASGIEIVGGDAYVVSKNRNASMSSNDDGTGNALTILDIATNPAVPQIVGSVRDPNNLFGAYGIAVSGTHAFVAAQGCLPNQPCPNSSVGNSFAVVDISDLTHPAVVIPAVLHNSNLPGNWHGTQALDHADSVAISGSYAYVTAFLSNRLTVVDISDPSSPTIIQSLVDPAITFPNDVAIEGHYAFLADQNSAGSNLPEFTVVDISAPSSPRVVASITDPNLAGAYRIHVSGDFAYVSASSANAMDVIDISDPTRPRLVWSDPDPTHFFHTTGVSLDSTGYYLVASSPYVQGQSSPLYPPFPNQIGGPTVSGTVSTVALDPTPIAMSITTASEPPTGTASTTANFQFAATNTVEAVECSLDGAPLAPCASQTNETYSGLLDGGHTFTVEGVDSAGNTAPASYTWTIGSGGGPSSSAPGNTALPAIAGTAVAGATLTAAAGTWSGSPAPTLAYQWQRCGAGGTGCAAIAGATAPTYVLAVQDVNATIEVSVTATNSAGSAVATSSPTAAVGPHPGAVTGPSGPTGSTGATGSSHTKGTVKIKKLAVARSHGSYVLRLQLSAAATVTVTVKRTAPGRDKVVEKLTRKVARGSATITLKLHGTATAPTATVTRYVAAVTAPGGVKKQQPFTVRR